MHQCKLTSYAPHVPIDNICVIYELNMHSNANVCILQLFALNACIDVNFALHASACIDLHSMHINASIDGI